VHRTDDAKLVNLREEYVSQSIQVHMDFPWSSDASPSRIDKWGGAELPQVPVIWNPAPINKHVLMCVATDVCLSKLIAVAAKASIKDKEQAAKKKQTGSGDAATGKGETDKEGGKPPGKKRKLGTMLKKAAAKESAEKKTKADKGKAKGKGKGKGGKGGKGGTGGKGGKGGARGKGGRGRGRGKVDNRIAKRVSGKQRAAGTGAIVAPVAVGGSADTEGTAEAKAPDLD
jgi:hypothetical protein